MWPEVLCIIWLILMVPQGVCVIKISVNRERDICRWVWKPYSDLASLPYGTGAMGQASSSGAGLRRS